MNVSEIFAFPLKPLGKNLDTNIAVVIFQLLVVVVIDFQSKATAECACLRISMK